MTEPSATPPEDLRRAIIADLRPVRPLRRPWVRSLALVPLAVLLLAGQPLVLGVRPDAAVLGLGLLWGLSALQAVAGLALIGAALREAVPGRTLAWAAGALLGLALTWAVAVTLVTWNASATVVPPGRVVFYWSVCFGRPVAFGLPMLAAALLLAWRAFPLRPALVGGLAGTGTGLVIDAGWRTFCHVSEPGHVLSAHLTAVAVLAVLGALAGRAWVHRAGPTN